MAEFDVRDNSEHSRVNVIRFANDDVIYLEDGPTIAFAFDESPIHEDDNPRIYKKDIPNLIKALQKAIELGWDK